mmetsp:Transcript_70081/g.116848  ORF Transcript_70081/g.116848 Transcript_70081/m.116848 type:complete len:140 (-) Transcript_70081:694-1113(-)
MATSPLPSQGAQCGRNGYMTPAISRVPNMGFPNCAQQEKRSPWNTLQKPHKSEEERRDLKFASNALHMHLQDAAELTPHCPLIYDMTKTDMTGMALSHTEKAMDAAFFLAHGWAQYRVAMVVHTCTLAALQQCTTTSEN